MKEPRVMFAASHEHLPVWPRWLCRFLTSHQQFLHFADYMNDVKGTRCFCGQNQEDRWL